MKTISSPYSITAGSPAAALHCWQATHKLLAAHAPALLATAGRNPTIVADFAVYFHCAHQAFGYPTDGALAQQLAQELARQPWPAPGSPWLLHQVDQASALAWLSAGRTAAGLAAVGWPAQLAAFDVALYQQVQRQPTPHQRGLLVRVARYLRLRQPAPAARQYLHALVAQWPALPVPEAGAPPLLVGLADGMATELLALIQVHQAGVCPPSALERLKQGLKHLLTLKRDVDFLEHQYSVFPEEVHSLAREGTFGAELSWRRGDLGQSWLLYEAQALLHDPELANIAELVGLNTSLRTSISATRIEDASFYRGAAGVAQLYGQLYRISGQPAYRTAYQHWLGRTLELLPATSPALTRHDNEPLGGLVGVVLVLLTATQESPLHWWDILV